MSRKKINIESAPRPNDYQFEVRPPDREHGHVFIVYGGVTYKWFLREDGTTCVLVNGDERKLPFELREAMKLEVRDILYPELKKADEQA